MKKDEKKVEEIEVAEEPKAEPAPEVKPEGNIAFVGMRVRNDKKEQMEVPPYYRVTVQGKRKKVKLPEGLKWGEVFYTEHLVELMATGNFKPQKDKGDK